MQRRLQLVVEGIQRGAAAVQIAAHLGDGAQALAALRHFHRIQRRGALVHQRGAEAGGAKLLALVGGVAGVEQQLHLGDRDGVTFGQDHFHAVLQLAALQLREAQVREAGGVGHALAAIELAGGDFVLGRRRQLGRGLARLGAARDHRLVFGGGVEVLAGRQYGEQVVALAEPGRCGLLDAADGGGLAALQVLLVGTRVATIDLALGQDHRLATETAHLLQPAHEAGAVGHLGALQFVGSGAFGEELLQLFIDDGLDLGRVHTIFHVGLDLHLAGQRERLDRRGNIVHQLVLIDQALVQPRGLAAAQHGGGQIQLDHVVGAQLRRGPGAVDARLRHMVVLHAALLCGQRGHPRLLTRHRLAGRDIAKVLLGLGAGLRHGDVAGQHQGGIGRAVVIVEPLFDIRQRGRVQVFHRADGVVLVRMVGRKQVGQDVLVHAAIGAVFALALFVLHHAALGVEFFLADGAEQVAHAVRFQPQRGIQCGGRHGFEVIGAVEPGGAVHVGGADLFQRREEAALVVFRAGEHEVLEQMREAGLAGRLVAGTDVVPDAHRHHRRLVVFVHHHGQAVGQGETGVGDVGNGAAVRSLGQAGRGGLCGGRNGTGSNAEHAGDQQGQRTQHVTLQGQDNRPRVVAAWRRRKCRWSGEGGLAGCLANLRHRSEQMGVPSGPCRPRGHSGNGHGTKRG